MKIFHFLFIFSFSIQANSQNLIEEGNKWNIVIYPTFSPNTESYSIKIGDELFINDTSYNKVLISNDSLNSEWYSNHQYIRQSSDANQVYLKSSDNPEILLYNFNLQIGDEFVIDDQCTLKVIEIDTIKLSDQIPRKRIKLNFKDNPTWGEQIWIKGIGSEFGMISHFMFCSFDYSEKLLCFYSNEELLYPENPSTCFITYINDVKNENSITIKPNPSSYLLDIEIKNFKLDQVKIYNLLGQIIGSTEIKDQSIQIDATKFPKGYYIIGFYKNGQYILSKGFIKN